uniref:Uncharacterized protein n=1 Tax=Rhizophora mucronata TaxID=61149 RepID=A0A2P2P2Y8_RHIMU
MNQHVKAEGIRSQTFRCHLLLKFIGRFNITLHTKPID